MPEVRGGMDLVSLAKEFERLRDSWLKISGYGEFPLTDWAHGQLADKLGILRKCYERMRDAGKFELLAENINAWLGERKRWLIRVLDGEIRVILSGRYRIIDNHDLVFLALDEFKRKETVETYRIDLSETMLYIKALDRTLIGEVRQRDIVNGGLIIRNSEVGASALRVKPFILRMVCENGLILPHALKRVHLGRQAIEINDVEWSDGTRRLEEFGGKTPASDEIMEEKWE